MMALSVSGVTVERGGRRLFSPLSFAAAAGTLVRIGGENGAGKTSLLRVLAGLSQPADGSFDWQLSVNQEKSWGKPIFIGHSNAMNDALSPKENMAFAEGAAGRHVSSEEIQAALSMLGVAALLRRRVGTLSQGQKKRVALARLFLPSNANAPWLLDEPFVALDAGTQTLLAKLISEALARGTLVALTSHQAVAVDAKTTLDITLEPTADRVAA